MRDAPDRQMFGNRQQRMFGDNGRSAPRSRNHPMPTKSAKKLFLVDAMGYIFRAFYAPMDRLQTSAGVPTKVPYLFATMMRRLMQSKQLPPDYLAVVFDVAAPTFRDKLFAEYKAQRQPMPQDLSIQLPFVRRYCEAMRLPILEYPGYEADDVIGTLAHQAAREDVDVYVVTSDKDLMQLVGDRVRVLNPAKNDLVIDRAKVEELMGVPPEKVPDVMALMGDSIDNIPGARDPNEKPAPGERRKAGIGEVGARQLIQQFGSAEEALAHASEVKRVNYREALEKYAEFVRLSKQLATIPTDAPVALSLEALKIATPDNESLRALYAELGFTTLLKEIAAPVTQPAGSTDYANVDTPAEFREFLEKTPPKKEVALWLSLDAQDPEEEGFGSRVLAVEASSQEASARAAANDVENKTLAAIAEWLADEKRPKVVHDPKLFCLVSSPEQWKCAQIVGGIRHATALYSYLLRPTTANHAFADVILRAMNCVLSGAPGERADYLLRVAPLLREEVEKQGLTEIYEKIDLPLAPVLARMEAAGVRVDSAALERISLHAQTAIAALEKQIHDLAGFEFKVNSPQQLAEVLFDKLNLQPRRKTRAKARSTAAEALEELALVHEMPRKVLEYRELSKLKSTYADAPDPSRDGPPAHAIQPDRHGDGPAELVESELAEYSGAQRAGARNSRGIRGRAGSRVTLGGLLADRTAHPGAPLGRPDPDESVSQRRGYSRAHRGGSLWRRPADTNTRTSPRGESDQFRSDLWPFRVRLGPGTGDRHQRGGKVHRGLFRAVPRRKEISGCADRRNAQDGLDAQSLRPHSPYPRN
jgi:DNA polymerase-1